MTLGTWDVADSRRRLLKDLLGIMLSRVASGSCTGGRRGQPGSHRSAGAMSLFVFAGASQFVAVGYVLGGFSWIAVLILTTFLNARHFLYGPALAPYLATVPRRLEGCRMAHLLTDEALPSRSRTSGASAAP